MVSKIWIVDGCLYNEVVVKPRWLRDEIALTFHFRTGVHKDLPVSGRYKHVYIYKVWRGEITL